MIYITGDTHIPVDISKLNTKRFPDQKDLTKDDYVIIAGDFGGLWDGGNEEKYWQKWLSDKSFTTLFIDGNHENFSLLGECETLEFGGSFAHKVNDSICHLIRGNVYNISGRTFFVMGGADSHDKQGRKEGVNWWPEEIPSDEEMQRGIDNLEKAGWKVDYVITHAAPTSVQDKIDANINPYILTDYLEEIYKKLTFDKWFFGHYHRDIDTCDKFTAVFNKIIKIDDKTE